MSTVQCQECLPPLPKTLPPPKGILHLELFLSRLERGNDASILGLQGLIVGSMWWRVVGQKENLSVLGKHPLVQLQQVIEAKVSGRNSVEAPRSGSSANCKADRRCPYRQHWW
ncbi:hypothetical protein H310_09687 [Aphanomyces invadans]|uniref:Uncharacterized protein n=1 Tax=Aphanomyces invadans TaxID=157072 RepID=A0A024TT87_9STRA|nr:hypothetical protein H310_09687 [Aphanomyces invadans]ETV97350.1 hypothetical protein H310_09687 [Aphanomyces invadans]|eukprot:XP_008874058.1 hypothetical protein H310_09687 [Aphanomyces invadans]